MKRKLIVILALLAWLAGCQNLSGEFGGEPGFLGERMKMARDEAPMPGSPAPAAMVSDAEPAPPPEPSKPEEARAVDKVPGRVDAGKTAIQPKIIRNAKLAIKSNDLDKDLKNLEAKIKEMGGYVASSTADKRNEASRWAQMSIRLPAEHLEEFMIYCQTGFKVEEIGTSSQDVTEEYMDLQARIDNAKREEGRLVELLENRTGKLQDVLEVERELARVREYIESMQGKIRYFDNRVGLSTVEIQIRQEKAIKEIESSWTSELWTGLRDTMVQSIRVLARSVSGVIIFIAAVVPWVIVFIGIVYPLYKMVQWRRKRRAAKIAPPPLPPQNPSSN